MLLSVSDGAVIYGEGNPGMEGGSWGLPLCELRSRDGF